MPPKKRKSSEMAPDKSGERMQPKKKRQKILSGQRRINQIFSSSRASVPDVKGAEAQVADNPMEEGEEAQVADSPMEEEDMVAGNPTGEGAEAPVADNSMEEEEDMVASNPTGEGEVAPVADNPMKGKEEAPIAGNSMRGKEEAPEDDTPMEKEEAAPAADNRGEEEAAPAADNRREEEEKVPEDNNPIKDDDEDDEQKSKEELCEKLTKFIYHWKRLRNSQETSDEYEESKRDFLERYPQYQEKTDNELEKILYGFENELETYFGEDLSDDSDSDEEDEFKKMDENSKRILLNHTSQVIKYASFQTRAINAAKKKAIDMGLLESKNKNNSSSNGSKKKVKKKNESEKFDFEESEGSDGGKKKAPLPHQVKESRKSRQRIRRQILPEGVDINDDLKRLNYLIKDLGSRLSKKNMNQVESKFVVLQCRGIHFYLDNWSKRERDNAWRRASIKRFVEQPIYAGAVVQHARRNGLSNDHSSDEGHVLDQRDVLDEKALQEQTNLAGKIRERLMLLRLSGEVNIPIGADRENFTFDNALIALQDMYTKNYSKFHEALAVNAGKNKNVKISKLRGLILASLGVTGNPFVSASDLPEHALLYALGCKPYQGFNDHLRLRPRWRKTGQAERPRSGIVYASLHEPVELLKESHHLVSMNTKGKVSTPIRILPERETSFLGIVPKGRVFYAHRAKFPSFKSDYKEIFLKKYGLNEELYKLYKILIKGSKPHSDERKWVKKQIASCLIAYYEACIIEAARMQAENTGKVLIYRDQYGEFTSETSPANAHARSSSKKPHHRNRNKSLNEKIEQRKKKGQEPGFLYNIQKQFTCSSLGMISTTEMLTNLYKKHNLKYDHSVQVASASPSPVGDQDFTFDELCAELTEIARQNEVVFFIYYAEFYDQHKSACILGEGNTRREIHLYYCGGGLIRLLEVKDKSQVDATQSPVLLPKQRRAEAAHQESEQQVDADNNSEKVRGYGTKK
jgi:hypothetical protein